MILSIIMPAYNAAKYLVYSIGSIINQDVDFNNIELIVINDGSTDNTKEILDNYAQKYSFIKVYHQENKGVSSSRNFGLSVAKGDYITFLDSDDAIYPNTINTVLKYLHEYKLDILYLNIHLYDEQGNFITSTPHVGENTIVKNGLIHSRRTLPATIYKKEILNKIHFPENISLGEDTILNFKAQYFAERVSYINIPYYKYTQRADSLSKQGKSEKAFIGFLKAIQEIQQFENEVQPSHPEQIAYINDVYHIFITRIVELNILPTLDKIKYKQLVQLLSEVGKLELLKGQDAKYPYISSNFSLFKYFQYYSRLKSKIYKFIFK